MYWDEAPEFHCDFWHDRGAALHFLTSQTEFDTYIAIARKATNRHIGVGTFSDQGPPKCSVLEVHRYSPLELKKPAGAISKR